MTRRRPSRSGRTRHLLLAGVLLTACGVQPQDEPQPVPADRLPGATAPPSADAADRDRVWGVRDQRLVPVFVELPDKDVGSRVRALLLLADSAQEATSIPRGTRLLSVDRRGDLVELVLTSRFMSTDERTVPLALAQIVFTVTEVPGVERARVETSDGPVPLVDAAGQVVGRPLQRTDFAAMSDQPAN